MTLEQCLRDIQLPAAGYQEAAGTRWNHLAKPLHGLGRLEEEIARIAGMTRTTKVELRRKALLVFCADNGVVEEGVTQTGSSVTAVVANNFRIGATSSCIMAECAGVDIFPLDIGVQVDTKIPTHKIRYGTANMTKGPAMERQQAVEAMETGIRMAMERKQEGYQILAVGEMGIGNTTTSSAVASVLLPADPAIMTGRGAGLTDEGLQRKREAICKAIQINKPDPQDPIDVLAKVGGLDLAGMAGVFLGGALCQIPVVVDGFIASAAALVAARLHPAVKEYMIPSHQSKEPGMKKILDELGLRPFLDCSMSLGEGTGALTVFPLLDMALAVYTKMRTFEEIAITPYEELGSDSEKAEADAAGQEIEICG